MPRSRPDLAARNRANATHGHTRDGQESPTFCSWKSMMQRSHSGSCKDAKRYLECGITVCERWWSFESFLADMGPRPVGCTLDRIDGTRGYEPDNCRWASSREQALNRRVARRITAFGRTQHITEWEREFGISHQALSYRLGSGLTPEQALTLPLNRANRWRTRSTNP